MLCKIKRYSMNANEKVLAGNADARYPDADNNST